MISEEAIGKYIRAGNVARETLELSKKLVKPEASVFDVVTELEEFIKSKGCELAFPVNLSIDNAAAHDTADIMDGRTIHEDAVVKVDVGVHVDGYIADSAITIDLSNRYNDMVKAAEEALEEALKLFTPERKVVEISRTIQEVIESHGFKPVVNLTGHKLERYVLHGNVSIPNVEYDIPYELKEGDVFAVEPFVTNGSGKVKEGGEAKIFAFLKKVRCRGDVARKILEFGEGRKGLPFSLRWMFEEKKPSVVLALRELVNSNALYDYRVLKDVEGSIVTQAEHSVVVGDKPLVYTK